MKTELIKLILVHSQFSPQMRILQYQQGKLLYTPDKAIETTRLYSLITPVLKVSGVEVAVVPTRLSLKRQRPTRSAVVVGRKRGKKAWVRFLLGAGVKHYLGGRCVALRCVACLLALAD